MAAEAVVVLPLLQDLDLLLLPPPQPLPPPPSLPLLFVLPSVLDLRQ